MMCKNLPAHQGSFLSSCQMDKRKETKSLKYQATLKVHRAITPQGGSGGRGVPPHPEDSSPLLLPPPGKSCSFTPILTPHIHSSKVPPPCNLMDFMKHFPSLLYFRTSELLTATPRPPFFNRTGSPQPRESLPIRRRNSPLLPSHPDNKIRPKHRRKHSNCVVQGCHIMIKQTLPPALDIHNCLIPIKKQYPLGKDGRGQQGKTEQSSLELHSQCA